VVRDRDTVRHPALQQGKQPFYIQYFYSNYGKDMPAIIETMVRHPNRVIGDAPSRIDCGSTAISRCRSAGCRWRRRSPC
jgi:hypothetical protein